AAHWPGPLTLALPARPGLPVALVQADCVAVRGSPDPIARALVRALRRPPAATPANPARAPPPPTPGPRRAPLPGPLAVGGGPAAGGPAGDGGGGDCGRLGRACARGPDRHRCIDLIELPYLG